MLSSPQPNNIQRPTHSDVLILGDLHFGLRGANPIFEAELDHFLFKVFFPYIEETDRPLTIVFLGDLLDDRTRQHYRTQSHVHQFVERLDATAIKSYFILGNHDTPFRDTLNMSPVPNMLRAYRNIHVIDKPTDLKVVDRRFLLMPWICDANKVVSEDALRRTDATVICGHFHLPGFDLGGGRMSEGSPIDELLLARFERVYSGHFHSRSRRGNIFYPGAPYQMTRVDTGCPRGFYTVHHATLAEHEVCNPKELFKTIVIDGGIFRDINVVENCRNKIVTIIVKPDADPEIVDLAVRNIDEVAYDVKVTNSRARLGDIDEKEFEKLQSSDTWSIINDSILMDRALEGLDRERISHIFQEIWKEVTTGEPAVI